ncbi:thioredoxin reductase [Lachnotalea glycerini]|uniref:Thioredoxin reductase n=1 Tax=Lachnotalea glycerini TaxID=1763509 RepID=A0A318EKA2_9FIRM|nr:NAD(P)/FAD-dependent oxidoreductase [Lachnotalea glycerini]PXV89034.1 thioredoxin reductase [Lachnotalea glycerini]
MKEYEIVIIGGGSAGLASAIEAYKNGCKSILILERDKELGGILLQCIHNGFGLHMFSEELSGPAYAERYIEQLKELGIEYKVNSMVIHLSKDKIIQYVNPTEGYVSVKAKAVILAMGCRERTRGAIAIPGYRPSGIWTAGTAQRYLNMEGYLVGKRVFILGSGDIGLIMARRMTLEGAKVCGVAELMPYSNGLPRNIKQCLEDFDIPLYLSHTITNIKGKDRINSLVIAQVDDKLCPIKGTEKEFEVDTLLLSVGLIPENGLSEEADILLHEKTKGAIVNESYETSVEGIFACGNVLHVHDLVDYVSSEGMKAGRAAAKYMKGELTQKEGFQTEGKDGIGYVLPHKVNVDNVEDKIECMFRVTGIYKKAVIRVYKDGNLFKTIKKQHMAPAEMEKLILKKEEIEDIKSVLSIEAGYE